MAIEVKVPSVGESIAEVQIAEWMKAEGDTVSVDETVATLDTDKSTVEVPAPQSGVLSKIVKKAGEMATVGEVIALMDDGTGASSGAAASTSTPSTSAGASAPSAAPGAQWEANHGAVAGEMKASGEPSVPQDDSGKTLSQTAGANLAQGAEVTTQSNSNATDAGAAHESPQASGGFVMPAAQRILKQNGVSSAAGTGPGGRVLKEDAQAAVQSKASAPVAPPAPAATASVAPSPVVEDTSADEEVVPMTRLRQTIARHLVSAQQTAALLTTFNEIDMTNVMAMRKEMQDSFTKKHEVKLGFMSFFIKASIDALKLYPGINAEIRGTDIVYRNHYDIGVAIGGGRGLVVPVLKRAERMSFAEIELGIAEFAKRAKANTLKPHELMGGTFTITNGGVYGSLLSTPIVNAPQSGILGMHAIQERPIAKDGQVVIRPMMYVALTYDHRIVDGREAVSFLVRVKECIENPARMLLEA
jgi:2-oxoglutarate dehydrogenase E2 component (dihydrolipoamide succinyltransferase)